MSLLERRTQSICAWCPSLGASIWRLRFAWTPSQTALIGPCERIAERLHAYAEAGVTTLSVQPFGHTSDARLAAVRGVSEALTSSGLVD